MGCGAAPGHHLTTGGGIALTGPAVPALLPLLERGPWSTAEGSFRLDRRYVELPNAQWQWATDWLVDNVTRPCDDVGWESAPSWERGRGRGHCVVGCHVRRRRWIRVREPATAAYPRAHLDATVAPARGGEGRGGEGRATRANL